MNSKHLSKLGITQPEKILIIGPPEKGKLHGCLRDGMPYVYEELEQELVKTARKLTSENTNIGAIVLECTQFPPFAKAIQKAVHMPVFDVITLGNWFYSGLERHSFPDWTPQEKLEAKQRRPRDADELVDNAG